MDLGKMHIDALDGSNTTHEALVHDGQLQLCGESRIDTTFVGTRIDEGLNIRNTWKWRGI